MSNISTITTTIMTVVTTISYMQRYKHCIHPIHSYTAAALPRTPPRFYSEGQTHDHIRICWEFDDSSDN